MTRQSFQQALKKGDVGEAIIKQYLESKGWVVYQPTTSGAHCFDMMSIKNKKTAIALDVKAKARMNKYPATGVNLIHFNEYKNFSEKYSMPFWIVFVDEMQMSIYGNSLTELEKPIAVDGVKYPITMHSKLRLWPLANMKVISTITKEQAAQLKQLNQRSYKYEALT